MKKILFIFSGIFISQNAFANQPVDWQLGFQKIVIEASEQSNRINVPLIEPTQNLDNLLKNSMDLIFTDLNSTNTKLDKSKFTNKPVCIIIGPEGDFSEAEREKILSFRGVQPFKINENILRSETAVISAISIVNYAIN